jgi:hypothetical protein
VRGPFVVEALRRIEQYPRAERALARASATIFELSNAVDAGEGERRALQRVASNGEARLALEVEIGGRRALRARWEGLAVGAAGVGLALLGGGLGGWASGGDPRAVAAGAGLGLACGGGLALVLWLPRRPIIRAP